MGEEISEWRERQNPCLKQARRHGNNAEIACQTSCWVSMLSDAHARLSLKLSAVDRAIEVALLGEFIGHAKTQTRCKLQSSMPQFYAICWLPWRLFWDACLNSARGVSNGDHRGSIAYLKRTKPALFTIKKRQNKCGGQTVSIAQVRCIPMPVRQHPWKLWQRGMHVWNVCMQRMLSAAFWDENLERVLRTYEQRHF